MKRVPGVGSGEPESPVAAPVSGLRTPTPDLRIAAIVFIAAFALYLKTLAPAVGPTDSGELTSAVWSLGADLTPAR